MSRKKPGKVGEVEVDGKHAGDELALSYALGIATEQQIWWPSAHQAAGGGRRNPREWVGHGEGLKGGPGPRRCDGSIGLAVPMASREEEEKVGELAGAVDEKRGLGVHVGANQRG